ncbi:NAD-dependent epimerase/dehydratase family protein [Niveibacterium sp. SC-1]|uniref:NAD-dependent epimerase/dehydratase family protein n=1 Tax=Niveibacterium sp. SC-1 TaxID=3135646 RepID=UPI00311F54F6
MVAQASILRTRRRILIVGSGDVARRALAGLAPRIADGRVRVFALVRRPEAAAELRAGGALPVRADLDAPRSLYRLAGLAPTLIHCAPPDDASGRDRRTRGLLAALARRTAPRRLVYISTSGVYGDCAGADVDETRPLQARTARARRRVDAETRLRHFARAHGSALAILRAPGIYAADRLPLARLERHDPVLVREEDVFTNHVHADDLARMALAACFRGRHRVYNASDDSALRMGDYYDQVADAFGLPRPPRLPRAALVERLSPLTLSFMAESRRLVNLRVKRELRFRFAYPTTADGLAAARQEHPRTSEPTPCFTCT